MTGSTPFPSTWILKDPYRGPQPPEAGLLKLDGNEGAVPPPEALELLASEDLSLLRDYPDPRGLVTQIAEWLGVAPARVVLTAGADDGLDRVCRAYLRPGRSLLLPVPAFEMMYRFAQAAGGDIRTVPWEQEFPTDGVIAALDETVSVVAMISPNNPTGRVATARDLERVSEAAVGALVVLDHVYVDYADEDLTALAARLPNVVIVRSFSKAWGLAGCRVGYAIAEEEVANVLRNAGNPFPVAGLSIATVRRQLEGDRAALRAHVKRTRGNRERLNRKLTSLGTAPAPSQGNFVFADFGGRADLVQNGLAALGISVRRFAHRPEIATGLRVTVPEDGEDLGRLEGALETVLAPEALLFDLDGVLADVEGSYRRCVLDTAASFGAVVTREDLESAVLGGDANNDWVLTQRILAAHGIDVALVDVTDRFQEIYLGTPEAPGLRESEQLLVDRNLLERLTDRLPLGIVTGRPRQEAEWFLERTGISDLFGTVVCMEDGPLKPDPAPIRCALSRLDVRRAWMVGDTPDDLRAAKAAGVLALGIVAPGDDPTATGPALRTAGAAVVLDELKTLEELLP